MTQLSEDAARFHNRLRILMGIDEHEFVSAGAFVDPHTNRVDYAAISNFMASPFESFIRADDATAAAVWSIVERRETKRAA